MDAQILLLVNFKFEGLIVGNLCMPCSFIERCLMKGSSIRRISP